MNLSKFLICMLYGVDVYEQTPFFLPLFLGSKIHEMYVTFAYYSFF